MKRLFELVICIFLAQLGHAQWPGMGKVEYATMPSKILNQDREYAIYLPRDYKTNTNKKYPVLYLLHGGGGSHTDWPQQGRLEGVANQLITSGASTEMIIVCPEAGKGLMDYFNDPDWKYEDYFFDELIPYIESKYRAISDRSYRAIAGLSMGGGGSAVYGVHHPEKFSVVYMMSSYLKRQEELFWIDFNEPTQKRIHQLVEDNSPMPYLKKVDAAKLETIKEIKWFIDCGDDDFTFEPNMEFVNVLRELKIPYELRIRDGNHTWEYWHSALYIALPYISDFFRK